MIVMLGATLLAAACSSDDSHDALVRSPQTTVAVEAVTETTAPPEPVDDEPIDEPIEREPIDEEPVDEPIDEPIEQEPVLEVAGLLPVDPAVRVGTLDNGLTYYLRNNVEPGTNLSLRLAVRAGSLHESEVGLGVAHYLEHMMFNGTEEYPGNEIIDALRGLGVEFGPDLNAYTSYDATVYMLDVVTSQVGAVDTAFGILSQWAHAATLAEADVDAERGVVRDELRLGVETGDGVILGVFDHAYVVGTPYEGREPIGVAESIESMTPETLRDFYEAWYVPSNMALIAVGDVPVDELEALVGEHFGAIPAGEAPPAPDTSSPVNPEPVYLTATSPSQAYSYMSLDLRTPTFDAGTPEGARIQLMESLIGLMMDARLKDAYEQGFLTQLDPAHWGPFSYTEGLRYYGTNLRAHDLAAALGDYWSMVLSLQEEGFSDADLEHAAEVVRTDLEFELQSVATRQDDEWSGLYVAHFLEGADIGTVADRVARVDALLEEIQPDELTEHLRSIMSEGPPIIIAVGADPSQVPTVEQMRAAIDGAAPGPVPARTVEISALMAPREAVDAVTEGTVEAIEDAYEWTFANGATVVFVPTDIAEAQVDMSAVSQGGWSAMEPGERALTGRLAIRAVRQSGVGGLSPSQVQRLLEEHNVAVSPFINETEEGFSGSAATDGIETMFQMLHLLVTAPQVEDQALAEVVQVGEIIISLAEADPDWQAWIAYIESRHPDSIEWFDPIAPQEALDALTAESMLDRYLQRLGKVDGLVVAVVGDADRDTVERMARAYVGTLPAGEADTFVNRRSAEPAGVVRREIVLPPDDLSTGVEFNFEAALEVDVALEVASDALRTIVSARLDTEVREELGASYSPGIDVVPYLTPEPGVFASVSASGDPEYIDVIETTIFEILADLVANGPDPDEWADALAVLNADYSNEDNSDYLTAVLRRVYAPDDELPTPRRLIEELARIEAADVQALAVALFDPAQHIDIIKVLG